MAKTIIKLNKFSTELEVVRGKEVCITRLNYTTSMGISEITVTASEKGMSTGGFHFTKFFCKPDKINSKKFSNLSEIVGLEAIGFVERLMEFVVYG